jgi:endo-1,4-beta-xylanase
MFQKIKSAGFLMAKDIVFTFFQSKLVSQYQVSTKAPNNQTQTAKGLKDYFSQYFPVGVAVNTRSLRGEDSALIVKEFNSIIPENDMKIGPVHPVENQYDFAKADAIVAFAQRNNLRVKWTQVRNYSTTITTK